MDKNKLGATGKFPDGKLFPGDEGELRLVIGEEKGQVTINFGKDIAWLAMPPEMARTFANLILAKANNIDKKG